MKLTKKSVKTEVEKLETVCEISQAEFDKVCAKTAASVVTEYIGHDADIDDLLAGITLTHLFAQFVAALDEKLFNDTNENPDKKEEK